MTGGEIELFKRVGALTGLSRLMSPGTVRRALEHVGARADQASVEDYRRAVPTLRRRLAIYLTEEEVERRMTLILSYLDEQELGVHASSGG